MFIKFILPRTSLLKRFPTKQYRVNFSTDSPVPHVKNMRLYNILMRYRFIQKMYANPKNETFFKNLFSASTPAAVISFLLLHELTAMIPMLILWHYFTENWSTIKEKFSKVEQLLNDSSEDSEKGRVTRFLEGRLHKLEKTVKRMMSRDERTKDLDIEQIKIWTVSGVAAFCVVKVFLPVRLYVTLLATPKTASFFQKVYNTVLRRK